MTAPSPQERDRAGEPPASRRGRVVEALGLTLGLVVGVAVLWFRFNDDPVQPSAGTRSFAAFGDLLNYYYPMTELIVGRWHAGEWPLWNPHVCSGMPLLATLQNSIFYPGSWLALGLPLSQYFPVRIFIECCLAGGFCLLLLRAWGLGPLASLLGGLLFVHACVLGLSFWPAALSTLLFLPWLLLCVEHVFRGDHAGWWLGLWAGTALQLFAGFPQYTGYAWLLIAAFALLRLVETAARCGSRIALQRALALTGAVALAFATAAIQLLPTLELMSQSIRSGDLGPKEIHYLTFRFPYTSGDVLTAAFDTRPQQIGYGMGNAGGGVGTSTLVLAVVGIVAVFRRHDTWLIAGIAAAALVLSDGYLGWGKPAFEEFARIPILGDFRTPERLRMLTFFGVGVMAATGFDALCRADTPRRRRVLGVTTLLASLTIASLLGAVSDVTGLWRPLGAAALGLLVLSPRLAGRSALAAQLALVVLVGVDVASSTAAGGSLRGLPVELTTSYFEGRGDVVLPGARFAKVRDDAGLGRIEVVRMKPFLGAGEAGGAYRPSCYEPLAPTPWADLHERLRGSRSRGATLFDLHPRAFETYYDAVSVETVLWKRGNGPLRVAENEDALPRAYRTRRYVVEPPAASRRAIAEGDESFRVATPIERAPSWKSGLEASPLQPLEIVSYAPERVVIRLAADPEPGLVVLTDSHYPGWRASVDGVPVDIQMANGLHRAVSVGPGTQELVFEYRPASFRAGAAITIASLALVILVATNASRRRSGHARSAVSAG